MNGDTFKVLIVTLTVLVVFTILIILIINSFREPK